MSTPEEKAVQRRAERERRQARVKASGSDRLAKITGVAGSKDFKPPVAEPRAVAVSPPPDRASSSSLFDLLQGSSEPNGSTGSPNAADMQDPLLAMLAAAHGNESSLSMPENQSHTQQQAQQNMASAQKRSRRRAQTDFYWDLIHYALSILLGLYAALGNPWNIFRAFVSVQVAVLATQVVLGHRSSGLDGVAMLAPFIGMLPKARQRQLSVAGGIIGAARSAYKDLAIVVFVYGVLSSGGRDFERPQ